MKYILRKYEQKFIYLYLLNQMIANSIMKINN